METFKKISLTSESHARLKNLGGFDKKTVSRKSIGELAETDLRDDVEKRFGTLRDVMGYRRKDIAVEHESGRATIRTPDLEYSVEVALDESDPSTVIWRRAIRPLGDPAVLGQEGVVRAFGEGFDTLVCEFGKTADIEGIVDRIEDREPVGVRLDYDSQCTWCEIRVEEFPAAVRIEPQRLIVGGGSLDPKALMDMLQGLKPYFSDDGGPITLSPEKQY